jgi:hypothetical protein
MEERDKTDDGRLLSVRDLCTWLGVTRRWVEHNLTPEPAQRGGSLSSAGSPNCTLLLPARNRFDRPVEWPKASEVFGNGGILSTRAATMKT